MFKNFVFYNSIRTIIMSITTHWGSKTMLLIFDEFNDISHYCIKQRPLLELQAGFFRFSYQFNNRSDNSCWRTSVAW